MCNDYLLPGPTCIQPKETIWDSFTVLQFYLHVQYMHHTLLNSTTLHYTMYVDA